MKISTEKFLKLSGSRNLDLISDVKLNSAKLSRDRMMLMQKSKKLSAENIQLLGRTKSSLKESQKFYLMPVFALDVKQKYLLKKERSNSMVRYLRNF